ncbi:MAG: carboxylating nicotinate-nucleotide diphosphorylase [Saprospiraceae bacterium]|jgi:nicotinate-nucleotide pyrophosphorylase (carboxylating)|nr:carboxylating nicotinate-nucleotide diphosphorylase [Saprospiraceae bacterium]MBP9194398.1 carboxylating nicotinate-nucleotide diphosphorylase [Saprospiraceae bacterium]
MEGIRDTELDAFIIASLKEDIGSGDHTSLACIPADSVKTAKLLVKDDGVIAGIAFARRVFRLLDPESKFSQLLPDGSDVKYGDIAFEIQANTRVLLQAERLVLNTMQRLSGIATISSRFATEVEDLPVTILDTRKTTPLMRFLEKWAVRIGGCDNYRDGLYDWIMIKDNHVDGCGSLTQAINSVHDYMSQHNLQLGITVEVRNLVELHEVLDRGGVTRIMLDNFEIPIMREAVATIHKRFEVEASGGVNLKTVRKIAETGVDYISVGALTHSAGCLDLSLKIQK